MKMRLTKKQIELLLQAINFNLLYIYEEAYFDSVDLFIDLLHLKQKIEKEVYLNAKKIK